MALSISLTSDGAWKNWRDNLTLRLSVAVREAVSIAASGAKSEIRSAIEGAGLGRRLGNTLGVNVYPKSQPSMNASAYFFPRGKQAKILLDTFAQGAVIRSSRGLYLAVPLPAAGKVAATAGWKRLTPAIFARRTGLKLRFVYRAGHPPLLVTDGRLTKGGLARQRGAKSRSGETSIPVFLLLPSVKIPKKFDSTAILQKWTDRVPELIDRVMPPETGGVR
jgi:hypothetical protein